MSSYSVEYHVSAFDGDTYFVPKRAEHRCASRAILKGQLYEPQTHAIISKVIAERPGNLLHAGTFFGDMIPSFSKIVGDGMLYAFEPVLDSYVLAKLTIEENGLQNVFLQNSALSSAFGIAKMRTECSDGVSYGGGSIIEAGGNETVSLMTIDSLGIKRLSCIHLDVEEHELSALQGATETIARERPMLVLEDNGKNCKSWLADAGYQLKEETPFVKVYAPQ